MFGPPSRKGGRPTVIPISLAAGGFLAHWLGYSAVWIIAGVGFLATLALNIPALRQLQERSTEIVPPMAENS